MKKIAANNRQLIKRAANKINKGKISKGLKTRGQLKLPNWLGNIDCRGVKKVEQLNLSTSQFKYYSQERQHNFFLN